MSFSVESLVDVKRGANLFRPGRTGGVVFDQHPCGDFERGGTGNPDRNRGAKNSTTRARRRPSLPLAVLALALISGVVRGLVTCGLLTLGERDASLSVTDRHIAFAGYVDDRLGNRTRVRSCPSMAFVLALQFSVENLCWRNGEFPLGTRHSDHSHRSTAFHQMVRSHSPLQVFAHCRCVHQREPNSVGSCVAATEKDLLGSSCRKMLSARRV
jgi:hypothetical protein